VLQAQNFNWQPLDWFGPFQACLVLGEKDAALDYLKKQATTAARRRIARNTLQIDPRLASWRDDKDIAALLAEPAEQKTEDGGRKTSAVAPTGPGAKSVAVLAFENLSDDKANEYFPTA